MFERKWHVGISVLISLLTISFIAAVLITPPVSPQVPENVFTVSPGAFTARQVPPMGEPYTIPQNIVVWNRDNVERVVYITSEIPPENSVALGYEPIPNENWVTPFPSSVLIKENSFAVIQLSFNIPRWENLTGRKWEVWIPVERQALPGEPIVYRPAVRIKIETTEELPAAGIGVTLTLLAVGLVIAVVVICTGVWFWSRRRGRGKPGKGVFFRR
jgi:hypothetical protein